MSWLPPQTCGASAAAADVNDDGNITLTDAILILEDNYSDNGWGSYILNILSEANNFLSFKNVKIIGPKKSIIPANINKERKHFVDEDEILEHSSKLLL